MGRINEGASLSTGPFANMQVGETRTHTFYPKDKPPFVKTITRTNRPFLYDWHDDSNRKLEEDRSNYRWVVQASDDGAGDARLVDIRYASHPDMKPWKPTEEELREAHDEVNAAIADGATMQEFKQWLARRRT